MCNNTNHCSYPIAAPVLLRVVGVWSLRSLVTSVLFWGPKWPKDRSGCSLGLFYLLYRLENNLRALNTAAAKGPPIHYSSSVLVLRWLCQCPSKALHYFAYRRLIQSRGNFFNVTPARHGRRLTLSQHSKWHRPIPYLGSPELSPLDRPIVGSWGFATACHSYLLIVCDCVIRPSCALTSRKRCVFVQWSHNFANSLKPRSASTLPSNRKRFVPLK